MFSNAIYMMPYDFGPGMVSKYLKCNLTKILTVSAEVDVADNINNSLSGVGYNKERFYLVKVIGNGYLLEHVLITYKEKKEYRNYVNVLDRRPYYDTLGNTVALKVVPANQITEKLLTNHLRDIESITEKCGYKERKIISISNKEGDFFKGISFGEVKEWILLGDKKFSSLSELYNSSMSNEYIKYITSLECEFLRNDKANQSELVAEEYLGVYKGKNFDELFSELQRRNNEIQKNICKFKLESSKEYALCMCLKELLFFYLGFRYIVKTKETFFITDEIRVKVDEAINVCNEGVSTNAITVIYNFIGSLDEKFCSSCLDEIIQMLRWKLEMASPYSESIPENIYAHYRTVVNRVEEICLECGISKRLPKKNLFNKNSFLYNSKCRE